MTYYEQIHQRTAHLHFTGKDYNGRRIIIDAAEIATNLFEVVAIRPNGDEVEEHTTDSLKNAEAIYNAMVQYHTTGTAHGMYTREDWAKDGSFSAKPGQEIHPEVFEELRNGVPPLSLPRSLRKVGFSGFLMGEPYSCNEKGPVYMAFIRANGHFFYYGLVNA